MPEMPENALLGMVIYEDGVVIVQAKRAVPADEVAGMLRAVADAVEHGQPLNIHLN